MIWIFGLIMLVIVTDKFIDYLGDAATGRIPTDYVLKLLWYYLLAKQSEILPLILFLSVILSYSRLKQDNELVIFALSGVGRTNQFRITLRFAVVFSVFVSYLAFSATPWAEENIRLLKKQAWQEANYSAIKAGQFKSLNKGKSIVYVEEISDNKRNMENIFLEIKNKDKNSIIKSESAGFEIEQQTGDRFLIFENGIRYDMPEVNLDYRITQYEKYGILIDTSDNEDWIPGAESLSTLELLGSDNIEYIAELQWRISIILACILLSLLAVSLNHLTINLKSYALFLLGILVYVIYTNLLGISRALLEKEKISPYLGLWWVHILLGGIILLMTYAPVILKQNRKDKKIQILPAD